MFHLTLAFEILISDLDIVIAVFCHDGEAAQFYESRRVDTLARTNEVGGKWKALATR